MSTAGSTTRLHPRAVLTVGTLVTVMGIVALATGALGGRDTAHATSPVESMQAQYAILRSSTATGLTVVASRQEAQRAAGPVWFQQPGGPSVATAREAPAGIPGLRVWVAATEQGEICVLAMRTGQPEIAGPGGTCASGKLGGDGAILEAPATPANPGYLVGVVPDAVRAATIQKSDGTVERTPVNDNVYAISLKGAVASVTFEKDGITHTIRTGGAQ